MNHIGEARLFWSIVERKLSWQDKLNLIAEQLSFKPDFSCRPFQILIELFKFRDKLAHGKTQTQDLSHQSTKPDGNLDYLDPEWISKYWSDQKIEQVLENTWKIMEFIHEKAGFDKMELYLVATGVVEEKRSS